MSPPRLMICPFCGHTQRPSERCQDCGTGFAPALRRAAIEAMGPWFVRDEERAFRPGCSYEEVQRLVADGSIGRYTIVRGPTTRQLWTVARHVPGIAHLLGYCHACDAPVHPEDTGCRHCGAVFAAVADRNVLGLEVEGEPAPTAPGRGVGFAPLPRGRLSAFASDEDLLDPDLEPALGTATSRASGAGREPARAARGAGPDREEGPQGIPGAAAEAVRDRSMPRTAAEGGPSGLALASIERSLRAALRRQRVVSGVLGGLLVTVLAVALLIALRDPGRAGSVAGSSRHEGLDQSRPQMTGDQGDADAAGSTGSGRSPGQQGPTAGPRAGRSEAEDWSGDTVLAISRDLEALARDRHADPDARRAAWTILKQRFDRLTPLGPAGLDELRERLDEVQAAIELDAVLPPEEPASNPA